MRFRILNADRRQPAETHTELASVLARTEGANLDEQPECRGVQQQRCGHGSLTPKAQILYSWRPPASDTARGNRKGNDAFPRVSGRLAKCIPLECMQYTYHSLTKRIPASARAELGEALRVIEDAFVPAMRSEGLPRTTAMTYTTPTWVS